MPTSVFILLAIGLGAGILSGLVGIGGGIVIVPALVYIPQFNQQYAQGTTLFMFLPPIGFLAVWNYHKAGLVDYKSALIMCFTFIVGSYFGSKLAISLDQRTVKQIFGVLSILVGMKMLLSR